MFFFFFHFFQFEKLKTKEASYMKALAEEWKKRDTEREVLMQKKVCSTHYFFKTLKTALL